MRIGPQMRNIADRVAQDPGCTMFSIADNYCTLGCHYSRHYGYNAIWRTVRAGLIQARERDDKKGCYRLYPVERT